MQVVYVLNKDGLPLMPTHRLGKVRHLLKEGRARIIKRNPFTIQLNYECKNYTQSITLGVDAGSKHIGLSASTAKDELYCSDVELRNDIVELLSSRKECRRTRRYHLRYRPARFNNRIASKKEGWLAPSIRQKIGSHLKVIEEVHKILPINKIRIELASFDTQLLKAQEEGKTISGTDYQHGEMLGWNAREYVLFRDNHECQCCHGKSKDKTAYENENNSITLCQYQSGSMGHNLQKCNKIIYFSPPLSSELYEQSKKRIHRIGQADKCVYYKLISGIEWNIYKTLDMRKDYTEELFMEEVK